MCRNIISDLTQTDIAESNVQTSFQENVELDEQEGEVEEQNWETEVFYFNFYRLSVPIERNNAQLSDDAHHQENLETDIKGTETSESNESPESPVESTVIIMCYCIIPDSPESDAVELNDSIRERENMEPEEQPQALDSDEVIASSSSSSSDETNAIYEADLEKSDSTDVSFYFSESDDSYEYVPEIAPIIEPGLYVNYPSGRHSDAFEMIVSRYRENDGSWEWKRSYGRGTQVGHDGFGCIYKHGCMYIFGGDQLFREFNHTRLQISNAV